MECFYCKGKMKRGKTAYTVSRKRYHFVLDDMPAWLCTQCGEAHFEEKEVTEIQKMLSKIDVHVHKINSVGATGKA